MSESPLIFLPGWGFDRRVLGLRDDFICPGPAGLLDPPAFLAEFPAWLDRQGIAECAIVGWSLGGRCALELARHYPQRVTVLHLLAVRAFWPAAELDAIRRELARQPADFLRSFYRKCFLGYRESYRRFQRELEEEYLDQAIRNPEVLERGLALLAAPLAPPEAIPASCRIHSHHGRRDLIAPPEQRLLWPGAECRLLEHGGHALFLDYFPGGRSGQGAAPVEDHAKAAIRRRFDRAAATYDANADIQRRTLDLLLPHLPPPAEVAEILELGCGTGNYTEHLLRHYPAARLTALDFSQAMLEQARSKIMVSGHGAPHLAAIGPAHVLAYASPSRLPQPAVPRDRLSAGPCDRLPKPGALARLTLLCRDGEIFLAANQTRFDLITANATLQWFADLPRALARIQAGLRPGGVLLATIFGSQTLTELEEGLQAVTGGRIHVAARRFLDYAELQAGLADVFRRVEISEHRLERNFADLAGLLRHFRNTGTGGPGEQMALGPRRYRELSRWFRERHDGFKVSFQIFTVRCVNED
ncbi:MAG: alpha/beta fold hydrolase [Desulfurivibrio sp.]